MPVDANSPVDDLDLTILGHLQEDGRKSFTEIAKALHVAVGTVRNRLNKMISERTVRIIPRVNPHRVGLNAPATINVSVEPASLEFAIKEIASLPEVSWLASITGKYDLVVDVMCRDIAHLNHFLTQSLAHVTGIREMETSFYLQIHKIALPDLNIVRDDSLLESMDEANFTPR